MLDTKLRVGPARPDGRIDIEVAGEGIDAIAGQLAGFGARLEIFEPVEVREQLRGSRRNWPRSTGVASPPLDRDTREAIGHTL